MWCGTQLPPRCNLEGVGARPMDSPPGWSLTGREGRENSPAKCGGFLCTHLTGRLAFGIVFPGIALDSGAASPGMAADFGTW